MKKLFNKYKDVIFYGIFGVLTTIVNIVAYYLCNHTLNIPVLLATIIAWIVAVLFAYITNRKWVFHSNAHGKKEIVNELISFISCRLATGVIDCLCMVLFVDVLHLNDVIIKIMANILVIVLNYIASKLIIFNNKSSKKQFDSKKILKIIPIVLFTFIIGFFLDLSPINVHGISVTDSSVFRNVAEVILNGGMPYKNIFDHKGPLLYIFNVFGQLINYKNGIWIIELISIFVALLYTFKSFNLFCKTKNSYLGTILISTILVQYLNGGNLTEEYAFPFIAISLFIFLDYLKNKNISKIRVIISGASFAAVCLIRINMIPVWIVFSIGILSNLIKEKNYKTILNFFISFVIGIALITLPIAIWLITKNSFFDFINQYFCFNFIYTSNARNYQKLLAILFFMKNNLILISLIINLFIITKEKSLISILNFTFIILSLLVVGMSGSTYAHYGMILTSCCIYPFAKLFESIELLDLQSQQAISLITYIILVILIGNIWINEISKTLNKYGDGSKYDVDNAIIEEINNSTTSNDYITVYGNKTIYYLLSNRKSSSKYYYQFPIATMDNKIFDEYFSDLEKNQPKLILVQKLDKRIKTYLSNNNYKLINKYSNGVMTYQK